MKEQEWRNEALCAQVDPEIFFPESRSKKAAREAIRICQNCLVVNECLADALTEEEIWGVRAGLLPRELNQLKPLKEAA